MFFREIDVEHSEFIIIVFLYFNCDQLSGFFNF